MATGNQLSLLGQYALAQHPRAAAARIPDSGLAPISKRLLNKMKKGELRFQSEISAENVKLETVEGWLRIVPGMRELSRYREGRTDFVEFGISTWEGAAAFGCLEVGVAALRSSMKYRGRACGNILIRDRNVLQLFLPPILIRHRYRMQAAHRLVGISIVCLPSDVRAYKCIVSH